MQVFGRLLLDLHELISTIVPELIELLLHLGGLLSDDLVSIMHLSADFIDLRSRPDLAVQ